MKTIPSLFACLAILVATAPSYAATKFYKWTDEQGVTHYTAEPPPSSAKASREVKVRTPYVSEEESAKPVNTAGTGAAASKDDKPADKPKDKAKDKEKARDEKQQAPERYAERCKNLQADLQTMQEHARVRVSDGSGEARVLSDEEKSAKQDEIQRQIKAFCE